jgi:hypothetical protein
MTARPFDPDPSPARAVLKQPFRGPDSALFAALLATLVFLSGMDLHPAERCTNCSLASPGLGCTTTL